MKKIIALATCLSMLFLSVPVIANATSSDTEIINTHGSKTYMGTYSDWDDTWDSDNFTDVTGEDVDCSDDLIIKGGKVGDVSVSGDLTISGGMVSDVTCTGSIKMSGGKADSLESSDDTSISGGTVSGDVESDSEVILDGKLTVSGTVTGADVTVEAADSGGATTVSDDISFTDKMILEGARYSLGTVDGQNSGTLELEGCTGSLPKITDVSEISVDADSAVSTGSSLSVDTLSLSDGAKFATSSTLTADTVSGPGALIFNAGSLTVDTAISDSPVFVLNGTPSSGTTAFKAESGAVSADDVTIFGYYLTKSTYSSSYDKFVLSPQTGNGVTLTPSSLSVAEGGSSTVTAAVKPTLSELSNGTQLCWKLIDTTSQFSITPNSGSNTCTVSVSDSSSAHQAKLIAYLADSNGNVLSDYKSAVCTLTAASSSGSSAGAATAAVSTLSLDTEYVTIPVGHKYSVLAITNAQTPPAQMSYNSAVAVVGKASAYSYHGKIGWLYPITAKAKGGVTINIGGQITLVTVS